MSTEWLHWPPAGTQSSAQMWQPVGLQCKGFGVSNPSLQRYRPSHRGLHVVQSRRSNFGRATAKRASMTRLARKVHALENVARRVARAAPPLRKSDAQPLSG